MSTFLQVGLKLFSMKSFKGREPIASKVVINNRSNYLDNVNFGTESVVDSTLHVEQLTRQRANGR